MRPVPVAYAAGMVCYALVKAELMTHNRGNRSLGSHITLPAKMTSQKTHRRLQSLTQMKSPVQTFYVPLPEHDLMDSFEVISSKAHGPINTLISIAVAGDNTIIWYDHHEDGYEVDVLNSKAKSTQVWGDGDHSNGCPPILNGEAIDPNSCTDEQDVLNKGDAIIIENHVSVPTYDPLSLVFDGKDKIQASFPVAITRGAYPKIPGSLLAGAVEVLDTSLWGTKFVSPVGYTTDSPTWGFEYTSLYVMADQDDTHVTLPDGSTEILNQGDGITVREVIEGDMILSNEKVQVHLLTGQPASTYEMRWYSLLPFDDWTGSYVTPVGTKDTSKTQTKPSVVWVFNPGPQELEILFETRESEGGFTVQPGKPLKAPVDIPINSGALFFTDGGEPFFAITQSEISNSGQLYDWGHPLAPVEQLTSQALVGWGYGCTMNNCELSSTISTESRSVVWVTPLEDGTTIVIEYGDGRVDEKPADRLESLRLIDVEDDDMTGATIYAKNNADDPVRIAVAWGQDPHRSKSGDSGALDLGTLVPPLPVLKTSKYAHLKIDADGDKKISPGDTLHYVISIVNGGQTNFGENAFVVIDDFDPLLKYTDYVEGSTKYVAFDSNDVETGNTLISDDTSGTAFPLDENGQSNLYQLVRHGRHEVSFDVVIKTNIVGETKHVVNTGKIAPTENPESPLSTFETKTRLNFEPSVDIELFVEGEDADNPGDRPKFASGTKVVFKYVVRNNGESVLENFKVTIEDDKLSFPGCDREVSQVTPGESFECASSEIPVNGPFDAVATVMADEVDDESPTTRTVTDSDPAYFESTKPNVDIELRVQSGSMADPDDADSPTSRPQYPVGTQLTIDYVVQNTGDVGLIGITVTLETKEGDLIAPFECAEETEQPGYVLLEGESFVCTVQVPAEESFGAVVTVEATEIDGVTKVTDTDPVYYGITTPSVNIELLVDDLADPGKPSDADSEELAPLFSPGGNVELIYVVTNDDEVDGVPLKDFEVVDDLPDGIEFDCGETDPFDQDFVLEPKKSFECRAVVPLPDEKDPEFLFTTTATVSAVPTNDENDTVEDADPVNYKIFSPDVDIELFVNRNGERFDADKSDSTKPKFPANAEGSLSYVIENTGNTNLDISTVELTSTPNGILFECDLIQGLQPGEQLPCEAVGTLIPPGVDPDWMFNSEATVIAVPSSDPSLFPVSDSDPVNYGVTSPEVGIRFYVSYPSGSNNLFDANNPLNAPLFPEESSVDLVYEVTNKDDFVDLKMFTIEFSDDGDGPPGTDYVCDPPNALDENSELVLEPGEYFSCIAVGVPIPAEDPNFLFTEIVTVTAVPVGDEGTTVDADDPVNYKVFSPKINIMLMVNGDDANMPDNAPKYPEGSNVTFVYMITNVGNINLNLTEVEITGTDIPPDLPVHPTNGFPNCDVDRILIPGQKYTCDGPAVVMPEDLPDDQVFDVTATVTADPIPVDATTAPPLETVEASDPVYYGVTSPSVGIKLFVEYPDGKLYDADKQSEAPLFPAGASVNLKYTVRNTDDTVPLTNFVVDFLDDELPRETGVEFTCGEDGELNPLSPDFVLPPGGTFMCTSSKIQVADENPEFLFTTTAKVTAVPVDDNNNVTSFDPVNYKVFSPLVDIELFVKREGEDKEDADDVASKPLFPESSSGSLSYTITNVGNTDLNILQVALSADLPEGIVFECGEFPKNFPEGESWECEGTGLIVPTGVDPDWMFSLEATVIAVPSIDESLPSVQDTDPVFYGVTSPEIDIQLYVVYPSGSDNLEDADSEENAPLYPSNKTVDLVYVVSNDDEYVSLKDVVVKFDPEGDLPAEDTIFECDKEGDFILNPFDTLTCVASSVPLPSEEDPKFLFFDEASVSAVPVDDPNDSVEDKDPVYYKVFSPGVDIELTVNGIDADTEPSLFPGGSSVTLSYKVTNTGNTILENISVDTTNLPDGVLFNCGVPESLPTGEMFSCDSTPTTVPDDLPEDSVFNVESTVTADPQKLDDPSPGVPTPVQDTDPVLFGTTSPNIEIKLFVEDTSGDFVDANEMGTSPLFPAGDETKLRYVVTNTDETVPLNNLQLLFNKPLPQELSAFACTPSSGDSFQLPSGESPNPQFELGPGESLTCVATGFPIPEDEDPDFEYMNNVRVSGVPTNDPTDEVTSEDPVFLRVYSPAITIMLTVNGEDANTPEDRPKFPERSNVTLLYMITNTGNTDLTRTRVDISGTSLPPDLPPFDCNIPPLSPGEKFTCPGPTFPMPEDLDDEQFDVIATVTADPVDDPSDGGTPVSATDPVFYGVTSPSVGVKLFVEYPDDTLVDANTPNDAPLVPEGEYITLSYTVKNTDDTVPLTNFEVIFLDDEIPDNVTFVCKIQDVVVFPFEPGFELPPFSAFNCLSNEVLVPEEDPDFIFKTNANVTAVPVNDEDDTVSASDPVHYKVFSPSVDIELYVNQDGEEIDDADILSKKPLFPAGAQGVLSYVITNTGNTALNINDVVFTEIPSGIVFQCGDFPTGLSPGGKWKCEASGTLVPEGVDPNWMFGTNATVTGIPSNDPFFPPVSDSDPVYYGVTSPDIAIQLYVDYPGDSIDRDDADSPNVAPLFPPGETVNLIYEITNMDTFVSLKEVKVTFLDNGDLPDFVEFECEPQGALDDGSTFVLEPLGSIVCTAYDVPLPEEDPTYLFFDTANVTAVPTNDETDRVDAADPVYYRVYSPSIDIQLLVDEEGGDNPQDADSLDDAALFPKGTQVVLSYVIKNTGNTVLDNPVVEVPDLPDGVTFSCELESLEPGDTLTCVADSLADIPPDVPDDFGYTTIATVAADPRDDPRGDDASQATSSDPVYYGVTSPEVRIKLYVEYPGDPRGRLDANLVETAPLYPAGDSVIITYVVSNEDNVVSLKDFQINFLPPGEGDLPADAAFICDPPDALDVGTLFVLEPLDSFECKLTDFPLPPVADPTFVFSDKVFVTAVPTDDDDGLVDSEDPVNFKVFSPDVDITLLVTGNNEDMPKDANSKDGAPLYPKGSEAVLIYMVENTGNIVLDDINIAFPDLPTDTAFNCDVESLAPGGKVTCTSSPTTIPSNVDDDWIYTTNATVTATPELQPNDEINSPDPVSDVDPVFFGVTSPEISIVLYVEYSDADGVTSIFDANNPTDAPIFPRGEIVKLQYTVSNEDNFVDLKSVEVTFPKENLPDGVSFTCSKNFLSPDFVLTRGSSFNCVSNGIPLPEEKDPGFLFMTIARVSAIPTNDENSSVQDQDPVNYKIFSPLIDIELFVQRDGNEKDDADENDNTKPRYPEKSQGSLIYFIVNTGNADLEVTNVTFTDPEEYAFSCEDFQGVLEQGGIITCEGPRELVPMNVDPDAVFGTEATVSAVATNTEFPSTEIVEDKDPVYYGVTSPEIDIEFYVDYPGDDEPRSDADFITDAAVFPAGKTVELIYEVTNTDDFVTLRDISVDFLVELPVNTVFTCIHPGVQSVFPVVAGNAFLASFELEPSQVVICTTNYTLPADEDPSFVFANRASVVGVPIDDPGTQVDDSDDVYVSIFSPDVDIELYVNGQEADTRATGPLLPEGSPVVLSYIITNTGNTDLQITNVEFPTLPDGVTFSCSLPEVLPPTSPPNDAFVCEATHTTVPEDLPETWTFNTVATVTGVPIDDPRETPSTVVASDPAFYGVTSPSIEIKLYVEDTAGEFVDANVAEGSPLFPAGGIATIRYDVTNTDETVTLNNLVVNFTNPIPDGTSIFTCQTPGVQNFEIAAGDPFEAGLELAPGVTLSCTATGLPLPAGEDPDFVYATNARVTGVPTNDPDDEVVSEDPVNFRVYSPQIDIMLMVNDNDANIPGSVKFPKDSDITLSYVLKNTGNTNLDISDVEFNGVNPPPGVSFDTCVLPGTNPLQVGGTFSCDAPTVQMPADLPDDEEYDLTATVTAVPVDDPSSENPEEVTAFDPVYYGTTSPSVGIKLYVEFPDGDLFDADTAEAEELPLFPEGESVKLTYKVTNTDNLVPLKSFDVTFPEGDIPLGTEFLCGDGDLNPFASDFVLGPLGFFICTSSPLPLPARDPDLVISTTASVRAVPTDNDDDEVKDDDPVNYGVFSPEVDIVLKVSVEGNEEDANDEEKKPLYDVDTEGLLTYTITNTGNSELRIDSVDIPQLPEGVSFDNCNLPQRLGLGETYTCESTTDNLVPADEVAGMPDWFFTTTATVIGTPTGVPLALSTPVSDADPVFFGVHGIPPNLVSVDIEIHVDGDDADDSPGPSYPRGTTVTLAYTVVNTGLAELTNINVELEPDGVLPVEPIFACDVPGGAVPTQLAQGEQFTCSADVTIPSNAPESVVYNTVAKVTGDSTNGAETVTDEDPVYFEPTSPAIDIEFLVNGEDADEEPFPQFPEFDSSVVLEYIVTNTGTSNLANIDVQLENIPDGTTLACAAPPELPPDDFFTCSGTVPPVTENLLGSIASVTAVEVGGTITVSDDDPVNYFVDGGPGSTSTPGTPTVGTTTPEYCTTVEDPKCRKLIVAGDPGQAEIGTVCSDVVVDNLEVNQTITRPDCCLIESHICNLPVKTFSVADPSDCTTTNFFSIDIWDVYSFVCDYDDDEFVVAGHATVQCDSAIEESFEAQSGRRRLQDGPFNYQAYFEIVLKCDVCLA